MFHSDPDMPLFPISVVARLMRVHEQTLRMYERRGLVRPARVSGHNRMYSQADLETIESIIFLVREKRVNLEGVRIILNIDGESEQIKVEIRKYRISGRADDQHQLEEDHDATSQDDFPGQ